MKTVVTFSPRKLIILRNRLRKALEIGEYLPEGWNVFDLDPEKIFNRIKCLKLKPGLILRAYVLREDGNGNGVIYALRADAPSPDQCKHADALFRGFLIVPEPIEALWDVMEGVTGDGSPWSYLAASMLSRELGEFGAAWHGCDWSTHELCRDDLDATYRAAKILGNEIMTAEKDWEWQEEQPADWKPKVVTKGGKIGVIFYSYSGHEMEAIYRHEDFFNPGSYVFESTETAIATGKAGYMF